MTDTEWMLVSAAKSGDAYAFAKLYQKHYIGLYRFAVCYMRDKVCAEDAVSSAVLKAYERIGELKQNSSFKSWLYSITSNECRMALRGCREDALPEEYEQAHEEAGYESLELESLMETLSEDERLVITLSVFSGYRSTEIAKMLDMRPGTVRSLKSRGLTKLREVLQADDSRASLRSDEAH